MTEDDAKTRWCPFARPGAVRSDDCGEVRGNRTMQGEGDNGALCIGSACMAWRIKTTPAFQENAYNRKTAPEGDGWKPNSPSPSNLGWWRTIPEQRVGYCGLAGAPV